MEAVSVSSIAFDAFLVVVIMLFQILDSFTDWVHSAVKVPFNCVR